jgi:hypothetical protein
VRGPEERAVLVSERSAVWDRKAVVVPPTAEVESAHALTAFGPMPTRWTPDLVHCRLVSVYGLMARLPAILSPAGVRSVLGRLQPEQAGRARRALTNAEFERIDWTWARVHGWPEDDQVIIKGFMSGRSLREVSKELRKLQARGIGIGKGTGKDSAGKRYRTITATMADEWNRLDQLIDSDTREAWMAAAEKKQ